VEVILEKPEKATTVSETSNPEKIAFKIPATTDTDNLRAAMTGSHLVNQAGTAAAGAAVKNLRRVGTAATVIPRADDFSHEITDSSHAIITAGVDFNRAITNFSRVKMERAADFSAVMTVLKIAARVLRPAEISFRAHLLLSVPKPFRHGRKSNVREFMMKCR
jgi:hypothetical protein